MRVKFGKLELEFSFLDWSFSGGIHIDFESTMMWSHLFIFDFRIFWFGDRHAKIGKDIEYVPDYYKYIGKIWKWHIVKHYQPYDRSGFFNLGWDTTKIFFWNYQLSKIKFKSYLDRCDAIKAHKKEHERLLGLFEKGVYTIE